MRKSPLQIIFLLAMFFTQHSWIYSDDKDFVDASGHGNQPWSESEDSGIQSPSENKRPGTRPPCESKGPGMYTATAHTGTFNSKVNIGILSDIIGLFYTYSC